jgi:hypothetical protein
VVWNACYWKRRALLAEVKLDLAVGRTVPRVPNDDGAIRLQHAAGS